MTGRCHFRSKNLCCKFWTFNAELFWAVFWKKNLNTILRIWGGGGQGRLEIFRKFVAWPVPLLVWVFFLSGHSCRLEILRHQMVENLTIETFKVLVIIIKIFLTTLRLQYGIGGCIWPQWSGGQHNIYQYCTLNVLTAGGQSSTQSRLQWLKITDYQQLWSFPSPQQLFLSFFTGFNLVGLIC